MTTETVARDARGEQSSVQDMVARFVGDCTKIWWEAGDGRPAYGPAYDSKEQQRREAEMKRFQDTVSAEARRAPRSANERAATKERIIAAFRAFAGGALGDAEGHLGTLLERGLPEVGTIFAQTAKRFDPGIAGSDVFQAMRNVWTMNCLQLLLGLPIQLTPAVFAYSMLYPYTDNYLDDPAIAEADKRAFNERFGRRLSGERVTPAGPLESKVDLMVGLIEGQFPRSQFPQVHGSLLAIHQAQIQSVQLMRRHVSPYEVDVLGISLEKGGTSVLADGYLVAGALNEAQAAYMFGWGAFLQLGDDLQDVEQDSEDGLSTVFSQAAGRWPLDALTDRALHFGQKVIRGLDAFDADSAEPVKQLSRRSASRLMVDSAGGASRFFTPGYIEELERHSAVRFSFLKERQKHMAGQSAAIMALVEAFARFDESDAPPPFPLPK